MIELECGCKFETNSKGLPIVNPDIDVLPDCSATWDFICSGNTKGVFQLDSNLGQGKAAEAKPRTMEELSDLLAILRPGCGDSIVEGKSLTKHYIDRKNGKDEVTYFHPLLEPILKSTQGILVYQEQAMMIAQLVAGFNLQQADVLRKAIGKKKVELMAKVKQDFLNGAKNLGKFSEHDAKEIFSWIEKSQKYSFNKSHSISYAVNAYRDAYLKYHYPLSFITAKLRNSDGKIKPFQEINELINNAKLMNIDVEPPSILNFRPIFFVKDNKPTFGITNVKKVGASVYENLKGTIKNNKYDVSKMNWDTFLMKLGQSIKSDSFENMIAAGVFDCYGLSRAKMIYYFNTYKMLKKNDKKFLITCDHTDFIKGLHSLKEHVLNNVKRTAYTKTRIERIEGCITALLNPPYELVDLPSWKAKQEKELLGIEITCHKIDEYDTLHANCTCREYVNGFNDKYISIAAQIDSVRTWTIKSGKNKGNVMAYLTIDDGTCALNNVTIFSDDWPKLKNIIKEEKLLLLRGTREENRGSFVVRRAETLKHCI